MNCSIARVYQLPWGTALAFCHGFEWMARHPMTSCLHFFTSVSPPYTFFKALLDTSFFFFSLPQDILVPNPSVFLPCVLNKKPPALVIKSVDLTLCPAQLNGVSLLFQQWLNPSGSFTSSFANTLLGSTFTNSVPEPLFSLRYNMYHQVAFNSLLLYFIHSIAVRGLLYLILKRE